MLRGKPSQEYKCAKCAAQLQCDRIQHACIYVSQASSCSCQRRGLCRENISQIIKENHACRMNFITSSMVPATPNRSLRETEREPRKFVLPLFYIAPPILCGTRRLCHPHQHHTQWYVHPGRTLLSFLPSVSRLAVPSHACAAWTPSPRSWRPSHQVGLSEKLLAKLTKKMRDLHCSRRATHPVLLVYSPHTNVCFPHSRRFIRGDRVVLRSFLLLQVSPRVASSRVCEAWTPLASAAAVSCRSTCSSACARDRYKDRLRRCRRKVCVWRCWSHLL